MKEDSKIWVTGHRGMVGSAVIRELTKQGYTNIITSGKIDLREQAEVRGFMKATEPECVFLLAATVGGINYNIKYPATMCYDNLMIEANVINESYKQEVRRLMYIGSSCMYPRDCKQPMKEEDLLSGKLEPTNEGYALAKLVGFKLCEYYFTQYHANFTTIIAPNLYGIRDDFRTTTSHVIPGMINKFHMAKRSNDDFVSLWGTGKPRREFLYVDDLAEAMVYIMNAFHSGCGNVGYGSDISIKELAKLIKEAVDYKGSIKWDTTKPDGMPRKLMDSGRLINQCNWKPKTPLKKGIKETVKWYEKSIC